MRDSGCVAGAHMRPLFYHELKCEDEWLRRKVARFLRNRQDGRGMGDFGRNPIRYPLYIMGDLDCNHS